WRFKLDQERIEWTDGILGDLSIDAASVSDPVLIRGDGQVLYTIASVVDDTDMGVTHVVRGSDHVTNTATQIQIMAALGKTAPNFAHHSLLTGPQGEALSKRLGTLALRDLRAQGIEPMAILSLMARLGTSEPVDLRATPEDLAAAFDLSQFGVAPTKFDPDALRPLSANVLQGLPLSAVADEVASLGVPSDLAEQFWTVIRDNISTRGEMADWWALMVGGATPDIREEDRAFVAEAVAMLPPAPYTPDTWSSWTSAVKDATGRKGGALFRPLRLAMTGRTSGPEMAHLMPLLQKPPHL
ncbi:MAG: glutamate--tRNA ligase family protein, partial [Pseudomonadota bacterium]